MPKWIEAFRDGILIRHGRGCATLDELTKSLSTELDEVITVDALFGAHRRHREKLNLKPSLMDYMGHEKTPKVKAEDVFWELSEEKWAEIEAADTFIVTSAMNNAPLHGDLWESIQTFAAHRNACIVVLPTRYRNPTTRDETRKQDRGARWPSEVEPHLTDQFIKLGPEMWLMGHLRIGATAKVPLGSGIEAISRGAHAVFAHPSLAMQTVPRGSQYATPKVLYTTQSCSIPNYSDTRAGGLGVFHHSLGALVIERDGANFHLRPVIVDDAGGFQDLDTYYSPKGVAEGDPVAVLAPGDEHVGFMDPSAVKATYTAVDSMTRVLKPRTIVRNDVADMYSISHHERKNPIKRLADKDFGTGRLEDELDAVCRHIEETTPDGTTNVFVWSNHPNEHLLRWLKETTPFEDPTNARIWHRMWGWIMKTLERTRDGYRHADPFAEWLMENVDERVAMCFMHEDDVFRVGDVDYVHGHRGSGGSKGSRVGLSKIGTKTTIGHGHAPGVRHGCMQSGTLATKMQYARGGPSAWAVCNIIQYANGKRAPIFVQEDGRWRATKGC